ncbi:cilia- and flagella-associated protein 52 [Coccinella septempunctata]|uniref:cilia- and flagella-associated protein 52 n=1 Tax=Coccinella septempunctata TaxID=41139 RepID=UPI001D063ED9|nr:cilia- and flagella-associated protein 52 [Coccinella septempunctata]
MVNEDGSGDPADVKDLEVRAIIGFDGSTPRGLIIHPNGKHILYPIGNKISIQDWVTKQQSFLTGHTNIISAMDVSRSGKYVASGQINHIGFKASVIIWDFEKRCILSQHELHKVRVEAVMFSFDDQYLVSLGGRDCGSVVVWSIPTCSALCGGQVSRGIQGTVTCLLTMNRRGACYVTGGENHLASWHINAEARSTHCVDVNMLKIKRTIVCLDADDRDEVCYCGTSTGDILKVRLNFHHDIEILQPIKTPALVGCYGRISKNPKKLPAGVVEMYGQGVTAIKRLFTGPLIVGAGDGTVELVEEVKYEKKKTYATNLGLKVPTVPALRVKLSTCVKSSVNAIQMMGEKTILVSTTNCEIFVIDKKTFQANLVVTCHTSTIYHVNFPYDFSEVFATASKNDVRLWSAITMQELLRIRVKNFSCSNVVFAKDGKSILTSWNDGVIRAFTPLTGRLIYEIYNAHNKGVSALGMTKHGKLLVSGGCEGQVRLWKISPHSQSLECTLKEHKGPISAIHLNHSDTEAVSASTDGSCIIWDIIRYCRRQILFANTLFMCARYYPTSVQILTGGSDRKISYWEVLDGTLVRELDASRSGAINAVDISPDGDSFVSGGNDQIVKLWKYQEGITTHVGVGHSGVITAACFSPDGKSVVTTDASGSVFIWKFPTELKKGPPPDIPPISIQPKVEEVQVNQKDEGKVEDIKDLPSTDRKIVSEHGEHGACCPCTCYCKNPVEGKKQKG